MAPGWLLCLQEFHLHSRQEEAEGKGQTFLGNSVVSFKAIGLSLRISIFISLAKMSHIAAPAARKAERGNIYS